MGKMSWNEFRSLLKGESNEEISDCWNLYKAGEYEPPVDDTPEEPSDDTTPDPSEETDDDAPYVVGSEDNEDEEDEEESTEQVEETAEEEEEEEEVSEEELLVTFANVFNDAFNDILIDEEEQRKLWTELISLAKQLCPMDYTCAPTDAWKLWLGPTSAAILVNETKHVAFACNREYWHRFYHGSSLCYVTTEPDVETVLRMRDYYVRLGQFVNRIPVPGHEIMLPQSKLEIINQASLMWEP